MSNGNTWFCGLVTSLVVGAVTGTVASNMFFTHKPAPVQEMAINISSGPTNGTTVLLFPEWSNSPSYLERKTHTNLYAVYISGRWHTRFLQPDGSLVTFWKTDAGDDSVDSAKNIFGLNVSWQVNKSVCDAFAPDKAKP